MRVRPRLRLADTVSDTASSSPRHKQIQLGRRDQAAFSTWSRRYTVRLMLLDVLVGMLAVVGAAALFPHIISFSTPKLAVLIIGAGLAWPMAVAASRGYERNTIGVGSDEMRAIFRGGVLAIAAGAVPSAITDRYGVVALCVMAVPLAGLASLVVRFAARKHLHHQQALGRNVRRVIVVGSADAAAELSAVLTREPHCGMTVVGACVPPAQLQHRAGGRPEGGRRSRPGAGADQDL